MKLTYYTLCHFIYKAFDFTPHCIKFLDPKVYKLQYNILINMSSLADFLVEDMYSDVLEHGDKLYEIDKIIDWNIFHPILSKPYKNKTEKGGRPEIDVIVMFKALIIQQMYGLSDPEIERSICDRISSFRRFLGWVKSIPDKATIWLFKERLTESGAINDAWSLFNELIDNYGLGSGRELSQDATYITADPGHQKKDAPRGSLSKTTRSKDGTWAKKGSKSFFGFKSHTLVDNKHGLIRETELTTASLHDSKIDLYNR